MIISNVNIGSGPGSNDGESIYSAFYKVNQNFANVKSNVDSLTNSVSSVAGRTGNVTLTINDIVGLNTSYALNGNVTQANIGMKGYVDAKIAANVAALVDSAPAVLDTLNELAAALNDDASFSTTILNTITLANTIQSNQITSANLGMKGYVDSLTYSNVQVGAYLPTYTGNIKASFANLIGEPGTGLNSLRGGLSGVETFGNTIAQFHADINSPAHIAVHNKSPGDQAVSGFMATADIGDENLFRTLLGVTNSGYTPNAQLKPLDSLLLAIGGNLVIGTNNLGNASIPIKDIIFSITNGSTFIPLRINATDDLSSANLELGNNVGILFNDGTRQTSAYSNVQATAFTNLSTYAYNANVTAANLGMKGYVDSVASQSIYGNANVASYLHANDYSPYSNVNVAVFTNLSTYAYSANVTAANLGMKGYVDSVASQSIYGNGNVKSYLTQFDGNVVPSANVTYSLGSDTNRWKDLYLSGNTIFLGDTTITTSGGAVLTPVTRSLFSQSFLPGSTNSAATFTLDRLATAGSTRTVVVIGEQGISPPSPAPSYTLTEGVDFTISGLSLIITTSYTATNISCTESYSDTGDLITATEVATDTITPGSGDLTVSGNVTVDGDLYVSPTSIYMGNLRISAVDGNLKVNTGIKFSDDSVQSTAWTGSAPEIDITDTNGLTTIYYPTFVENRTTGQIARADTNLTYRTDDNILGVGNIAIGASGNITFPDSTVQTTAWTGTVSGGSVSGNVAEATLAYAVNISPVLLNQEYSMAILPTSSGAYGVKSSDGTIAFTFNPTRNRMIVGNIQIGASGNITFADGTTQITAATYSNVQVATYLPTYTGSLTAGNVSVPGTSGKIGFSSGGFAQQATSNSTQVTSHFTSGNIQLMSIDLGANAAHTVAFACNKLTTNDILVVKHVSGGLTSVYVDAYVQSDGLAIIWMRDITGNGTGAFTPMLKYAIIRAPSS